MGRKHNASSVHRIAVGANVCGGEGYVSLDNVLAGTTDVVAVVPMWPTVILGAVTVHVEGGRCCG